ncbi:MAG TPA: hypothetical protein VFD39_07160 [Trueperaceae bacterium]|nr:hypothetical protein [Trueperaceae bacterium]
MGILPAFVLKVLAGASPPTPPGADEPGVTQWRDSNGTLGALSHASGGEHWLHVLGVASFRIPAQGNEIAAIAAAGSRPEAVSDEFQRTAWPAALQLRGHEVLHASAVATPDGVVAFCARSETGKSTLAYGLAKRGHRLWSDDAVVLSVTPTHTVASSLPFQVRLRPASAAHFGFASADLERGRLRQPGSDASAHLPLKRVCLLERAAADSEPLLATEQPPPAAALAELLQHAIYFSAHDLDRRRLMLRNYLTVLGTVPVLAVRFRPGMTYLDSVLDAVEERLL